MLCGGDGQETLDLCGPCQADLPANDLACRICSQPLIATSAALLCGACLRRPPRYQASCVPFRYAYPLEHLIRGLKYRRDVVSGRVLGDLLGRRILAHRDEPLPDAMIPVPLTQRRYCERGYNQATELALRIHKCTGVALRLDVAVRTRETQEQATLSRKDRRKKVPGSMSRTA